MSDIRKFARKVGRKFKPEKIILFGSYAYGTPSADSDVDILVVMPARNQHDQAVKIRWEVPRSFPMDLIVWTPKNLGWRLAAGESFHTEIMTKGKVLYEAKDARMGEKGRRGLSGRNRARARQYLHSAERRQGRILKKRARTP